MTSHIQEHPEAVAKRINVMLGVAPPVPGTSANGWFPGYGCRWCPASKAWFTVVPFTLAEVASSIAMMFTAAGLTDVTVSNEGGVSQDDGGRGLQVSAYV